MMLKMYVSTYSTSECHKWKKETCVFCKYEHHYYFKKKLSVKCLCVQENLKGNKEKSPMKIILPF